MNNKLEYSSEDEEQQESFADIIKGPLKRKFYLTLIDLEHQISNKLFYSMQQVLDLVGMYGKCVEYFDQASDPVRWYFLEKISCTLAESKTRTTDSQIQQDELFLVNEEKFKEEDRKAKAIKPITTVQNIKQNPLTRVKTTKIVIPTNTQSAPHQRDLNNIPTITPDTFDFSQFRLNITEEDEQMQSISAGDIRKFVEMENASEKRVTLQQHRETRNKKLTLIEEVIKQKDKLCHGEMIDQWGRDTNEQDEIVKKQLDNQKYSIDDRLKKRKTQQLIKKIENRLNDANDLSVQVIIQNDYQLWNETEEAKEIQESSADL